MPVSYMVKDLDLKFRVAVPDECSVCLSEKANMFSYCSTYHLTCCEKCIVKLDTCPICREKILCYKQVKTLPGGY